MISPCAICGEPGRPLYERVRDRLFGVPGEWSLLVCPGCALVWLSPRPSAGELDALYHDYYTHDEPQAESRLERVFLHGVAHRSLGYRDSSASRGERVGGALAAAIGPLREVGERAHMWLPAARRGRLLDVGCGSGAFLARMRELGWQVWGSEADPEAARSARARLGDEAVHAGPLETLVRPDGGFDAITLSHVIEHLPDPEASLRSCHALLRPDGWLVVATPNTASLGRHRFGRDWLHWDPPRHLQLFDATTLERIAQRSGFRTRVLHTPSSSAHFVYRAGRLLQRDDALPGARVDHATRRDQLGSLAFWAWESLLVRLGRRCGEELLLIAERPSEPAVVESPR